MGVQARGLQVVNVTHYYQYSCPIDGGLYALNRTPLASNLGDSSTNKVPSPPPYSKRSTSLKGLRWWPDDPFLAAYKECTKSGGKTGGSKLSVRIKKIRFSCKNSCDVRENNLMRLSNLPTPPKSRIGARQEFV
ncbi:Detected protein of unknown function [Hibiscus syriacus]|uniref:Uncharacterized protein n=1 Tax=Hibiscus syriacus TaxID=106335 RepID=A0A6A3BGA0_HIBSY|nr:Detected protein of unknown function [Hibiscus syriacus]